MLNPTHHAESAFLSNHRGALVPERGWGVFALYPALYAVVKGFLKGLFVLLLTTAVFGGGGYYTYLLYIHPEIELEKEKTSGVQAQPAFKDPTLEEFQKCLQIEAVGDPLASRRGFAEFLDNYPDSSKADEARTRLGAIQSSLLFSPRATPEKQIIIVKPGEVLNKLSHRLKTSPELLLAINRLETPNLRVGQRLYSVPSNFSALIDRASSKVTVLRDKEFFTQYPILETKGSVHVGPLKKGAPSMLTAKVQDKPGWKDNVRLNFGEKVSLNLHAGWSCRRPVIPCTVCPQIPAKTSLHRPRVMASRQKRYVNCRHCSGRTILSP